MAGNTQEAFETQQAWVAMEKPYAVVVAADDDVALLKHARQMRLLCESVRDRHRRRMLKMTQRRDQ